MFEIELCHSGGMCDPKKFHAAIDEMANDVVLDGEITKAQAVEGVLMMILAMVTPAGSA